ncbi:MAG TPA: glycosyltransferase [Phycisphaerales bacterium]|nr:glycosyltransferase [Phycisphaerales bacterium]
MTAVSHTPTPVINDSSRAARVRAAGKFLFEGDRKFYVKGVTYGPFRPGPEGEYHTRERVAADFRNMAAAGINTVRVYTMPPRWMLDLASAEGLRVLLGAAWAQHLNFVEDRRLRRESIDAVVRMAREYRGHPGVLAYCIGNEVPAPVVRWYGYRRIEAHLRHLSDACKQADPDTLVTYVNYPSTEYLELPFLDFLSFNVFLEDRVKLERYLARIQNLAGERPLLLTEIGLDSLRNGEGVQAASLSWQVRAAFATGCAGACVFSWTDEWHRGGEDILDWRFGLTRADRTPKPALSAVRSAFAEAPCLARRPLPRATVVVCTYNGSRTIRETLEALARLDYPDFEVIVVNDGSTDCAGEIAAEFPFRVITTENRGLSAARNTGWMEATGEVIAYVDDDAAPDPQWLQYLAATLLDGHAGAGGPNLHVPSDGPTATCVSATPGNPTHVLLSDTVAEHVPGCNMAYWRWALEAIGGFDHQFRIAGDDVDVCWRLQDRGWTLGFSPAAQVWHHRRGSVRSFWRQQRNYGRAEADLERKWPEKYNAVGHARWAGRLYAGGSPPSLAPSRRRIYHGVWGMALFQHVYPTDRSLLWALPAMPEWHGVSIGLAVLAMLGIIWPGMLLFAGILGCMLVFAGVQACVHAARAPVDCRWRGMRLIGMRALIAFLYLMQPMARFVGRVQEGLTPWRFRGVHGFALPRSSTIQHWSAHWRDPFQRLADLEGALRQGGAVVVRGHEFAGWDLELRGGLVGRVRVRQFTSDLPKRVQWVRWDGHPRVAPLGTCVFLVLLGVCWVATRQGEYILASAGWLAGAILAVLAIREIGAAMATFRRVAEGLEKGK